MAPCSRFLAVAAALGPSLCGGVLTSRQADLPAQLPEKDVEAYVAKLQAAVADIWAHGRDEDATPRYIVARPDQGWGNRWRSFTSSLVLALVTRRRMVIDYPDFFKVFSEPSSEERVSLDYRSHAAALAAAKWDTLPSKKSTSYEKPIEKYTHSASRAERAKADAEARAACQAEWQETTQAALRSQERVLLFDCSCTFEHKVLRSLDPRVQEALAEVFGTLRGDAIVEVMVRFLASKPNQELVGNGKEVLDLWDRQDYDGFAMLQDMDRADLDCTYQRLAAYKAKLPGQQRLLLGLTLDSEKVAEKLEEKFKPLGDVRVNTLFSKEDEATNFFGTDLVERQFLVDWYVLGEAPFVVCTGSSYCVSARARKGFGNDGTFPFASGRESYRAVGPECSGAPENRKEHELDTLTAAEDGYVFW